MLINTSIFLYLSLILTLNTCLCERSRPQTPKRPFKYIEKDVEFRNNEANVTLSGSLTYPRYFKPTGAVILAHGSGGQDRDHTTFGNKSFLVVADYLTKYGLAVLRYDERGIGKSTGNFTQADDIDFAKDAISGVKFLRHQKYLGLNNKKIGIVGFSKGCFTAIIAANRSKHVGFVVLAGFAVMNGEETIILQSRKLAEFANRSLTSIELSERIHRVLFDLLRAEKDAAKITRIYIEYLDKLLKQTSLEEEISLISEVKRDAVDDINEFLSPWGRNVLAFNATKYLIELKIPLLGLWGTNDYQTPLKENMPLAKKALEFSGNKNFKLVEIKNANHLFEDSITGSPDEYGKIKGPVFSNTLKIILDWIRSII